MAERLVNIYFMYEESFEQKLFVKKKLIRKKVWFEVYNGQEIENYFLYVF